MGNRNSFERLPEKKLSQSLSFESLPGKNDKDDAHSTSEQELFPLDSRPRTLASVHSKPLCLTLIILTTLAVIIVSMTFTAVLVTAVVMKNVFVSKAEFFHVINESHNHCTDKIDSMEVFYNNSLTDMEAKITDLNFLLSEILASQAKNKKQLDAVHADSAKQILALQKQVNRSEIHTSNLAGTLANKTKSMQVEFSSLEFSVHQNLTDISRTQSELQQVMFSLEANISLLSHQIGIVNDGIQQARNQLSAVQSDTSLSSKLNQLQQHIESISAQMHHPVNLYKQCKEDTTSCSIDPNHSHDYWRDCATAYLPLNKEVCYQLYAISYTGVIVFYL